MSVSFANEVEKEEKEEKEDEKKQSTSSIIAVLRKNSSKDEINVNQLDHNNNNTVEELTCEICFELFDDPCIIIGDKKDERGDNSHVKCPHVFCRQCIENTFKTSKQKRCPVCKVIIPGEDLRIISVGFLQLRINNLRVKCAYHQNINNVNSDRKGCSWQSTFGVKGRDYLNHIDKCPHRGTECKDCKEIIVGYYLLPAAALSSSMLSLSATASSGSSSSATSISSSAAAAHEEKCLKRMTECVDCKEGMIREAMEDHKKNTCPKSLIECEFKNLNLPICKRSFSRIEYGKHNNEFAVHHLKAMSVVKDVLERKEKELTHKLDLADDDEEKWITKLEKMDEELTKACRIDMSNKFIWKIDNWYDCHKSPTFSACGLLWMVFMMDGENDDGEKAARIVVKPQTYTHKDQFLLRVALVGKHGKTCAHDHAAEYIHYSKHHDRESETSEEEEEDDEQEQEQVQNGQVNGRNKLLVKFAKFTSHFPISLVEELVNDNDGKLEVVVVVNNKTINF